MSYLFLGDTQIVCYLCHHAFTDHHGLGCPKAPEGCVGGQVGATQVAHSVNVWYIVAVCAVVQSTLHYLHVDGTIKVFIYSHIIIITYYINIIIIKVKY